MGRYKGSHSQLRSCSFPSCESATEKLVIGAFVFRCRGRRALGGHRVEGLGFERVGTAEVSGPEGRT